LLAFNRVLKTLSLGVFVSVWSLASGGEEAPANCHTALGQMVMVSIPPEPSPLVGGITLFTPAIEKAKTPQDILEVTRKLQSGRKTPLFIAVDQEGGKVERLNSVRGFTELPRPALVGSKGDPNLAYEFGRISARELGAVGINVNFGTIADVNTNAQNPVIGKLGRSYSADASTVAKFACANLIAYKGTGVIPVLKHFPGHGDTAQDSHLDFATVNKTKQQLDATELLPFRQILQSCLREHGVSDDEVGVMTAHLLLPKALGHAVPSSLSREVVTNWLQKEIGFKGLVFSDSLAMEGVAKFQPNRVKLAIQAIKGGNDVLTFAFQRQLFATTEEEEKLIADICEEARTDVELLRRIHESADRIARVKSGPNFIRADHIPDLPSVEDWNRHRAILTKAGFPPRPPTFGVLYPPGATTLPSSPVVQ